MAGRFTFPSFPVGKGGVTLPVLLLLVDGGGVWIRWGREGPGQATAGGLV